MSLDTTSFASLGPWKLKDSPQTGAWTGDVTDSNTEDSLQSSSEKGWCSTWGADHFSTFDHHEYEFKGMCNYIFTATCGDASPTFSIQLRRDRDGNISRIIMELGASVVTVNKAIISVRDIGVVSLPYTSNGLQITPYGQSVQLVAKQLELELVVMWGPDAYLMVLVEKKYMGKLCGLCGNFDGKTDNEFLSEDGKLLEPYKYAVLQKLDDPNEICAYEAIPSPTTLKTRYAQICNQLLTLVSPACDVPKESLVLSCQADMAECAQPGQQNCSCATLSEYSRRCSMAGQPVRNWRTPGLCPVGQCPANQVYQECGEVCIKTCSNPQHSCSSFCNFGCFCPHGTLLDDISRNHTCVPVSQCPCMLNGVIYGPGEITRTACQTCQCTMGRWTCTEQPCPGHCSLEGGSFVTTFDARPYRFHGTCTYTLLQSPLLPNNGTLLAVYDKSGYSHSETSLVSVIYLSKKDKIVISTDEVITNNGDTKVLPYKTHNITIFRQTSTHLQMATTFGLEVVVQLQPVFQAYITVGPQFRGQTRGLCGNFNGDTTDDFTTSMGLDEGTASLFVDSWRAGNCPAALERETDPCSMSQLNKVCAETHCSMLLKKGSVFEKCHTAVNPQPFYKVGPTGSGDGEVVAADEVLNTWVLPSPQRCVYQACNYEETFPHICSALGAYAHACSSRGVLLLGWRSSVDNCTVPCTGNRTFSYNSKACDRTCLSLSDRETECHTSAVPVDGCNCPEGTYLNHKAECVHKAQCPCLLDGSKFVQADQSTMINGVICYCINGRLSCPRQAEMFLETCLEPKTFQSCSQSSEDKFGAACAPTCQMLATGIDCVSKAKLSCPQKAGQKEKTWGRVSGAGAGVAQCEKLRTLSPYQVPTKCESGCICPKGLYENSDGQCVPAEECPCDFAGVSYPGGSELHTDCKTCTCSQGRWTCQLSTQCPSTCVLYGEGHVITFDGQRFVFDGNCEYTLATDDCGANSSQPTFKVLTENVICGKSGVTCSRAIKISLGGLSITMAGRNYTVSGEEPLVHLQVKPSPLNLVLDIDIPGRLNLTLVWNKHMSVSIKISRATQDALCGLCGNSNGNMKDDFETRSKYVASSELEFVNSWKENPLCGDASYVVDPCSLNTFRRSWAERKCNIINSQTFAACHSKVYHLPYYEACVRDTCGCDMGGDCECLCDAVAAYAKACLDKGVCVDWRAPDFCPVYCDFYNIHTLVGENKYQYAQEANCTWHYQPCLCPGSLGTFPDTNIEGCYNCSQNEYFDHTEGTCVPCGSQPTTATPTSTEFRSSSSAATPMGPSNFPGIPTPPPSAPSSTEEVTEWTTPKKSTVSSGEYSPTTVGTTPMTSRLPPTSIPKSTPTRLPVTQATTKPTASSSSSSTKTTAEFTESTTVTSLTSAKPGMSTSQEQSTTARSETPIQTTIFPQTQNSLPSVNPTLTTSQVTPTSQALMTPTASHVPPSPSTINTSTTKFHTTTVKGADTTHTLASGTYTTKYTTQNQNSFSTETTSASLTHPSKTTQQRSTSLHPTTVWKTSTMGVNSSPEVHTTSGTTSPNTPQITHLSPTVPVSSTIHTTGPTLSTSMQTTITFSTPSTPQTTSTQLPLISTSSVTSNSMTISSHTVQHTLSLPSTSMTRRTATPTTMEDTTRPPQTTTPDTYRTSATTQTKSSFSTERTSTSHNPQTSMLTSSQSTSAPVTPILTTFTMGVTGTPVVHTTSVHTTGLPHRRHTEPPPIPSPSGPQTSCHTPQPPLPTSSVTPNTKIFKTPTSPHSVSLASTHVIRTVLQPPWKAQDHLRHQYLRYTTSATTLPKSTVSTDRTSTASSNNLLHHTTQSVSINSRNYHVDEAHPGTSTSNNPQTSTLTSSQSISARSPYLDHIYYGCNWHPCVETTENPHTPTAVITQPALPHKFKAHSPRENLYFPPFTHFLHDFSISPHQFLLQAYQLGLPCLTVHTTGLPSQTSIQTTSNVPSPSGPQTSLTTRQPSVSTSSVTTSETLNTLQANRLLISSHIQDTEHPSTNHSRDNRDPTYTTAVIHTTSATTQDHSSFSTEKTSTSNNPQTSTFTSSQSISAPALNTPTTQHTNIISSHIQAHSTPLQTTVETKGTPHTPTAVIYTTSANTRSQSFSTEKTSTSNNPQTSTFTSSQSTSAPVTPILTTSTRVAHTRPAQLLPLQQHTPQVPQNFPRTTITFPTPSVPQTSLTTPQPSLSTSSVTTSEALNTPTTQQDIIIIISSQSRPHSTPLQTTVETTGTPTYTTAVIYTTSATTQAQSTFSTGRTSTSHLSHTSSMTAHQSISVPATSASLGLPCLTWYSCLQNHLTQCHTTGLPSQTSIQTTSMSHPIRASDLFDHTTAIRHRAPPLQTTVETTETPHTPTAVIHTTIATTQAHSSLSTERTSTSNNPQTSTLTSSQSTSAPRHPHLDHIYYGCNWHPCGTYHLRAHTRPHSCYLSNNTHLKYLRNFPKDHHHFPTPSGPQTSVTTPQPSMSTSPSQPLRHLNPYNPTHNIISSHIQATQHPSKPQWRPQGPHIKTARYHHKITVHSPQKRHYFQQSTNFHVHLVSINISSRHPILTTSTMGVTGTPVVHTTSGTHSSTQNPTEHTLSAHSCYLSNNTHLKYLRNFPKDHHHLPNTISASDLFDHPPQPSLSTSSVTTSEALNTPTTQQTSSSSSAPTSRPHSTPLQTQWRDHRDPHIHQQLSFTQPALPHKLKAHSPRAELYFPPFTHFLHDCPSVHISSCYKRINWDTMSVLVLLSPKPPHRPQTPHTTHPSSMLFSPAQCTPQAPLTDVHTDHLQCPIPSGPQTSLTTRQPSVSTSSVTTLRHLTPLQANRLISSHIQDTEHPSTNHSRDNRDPHTPTAVIHTTIATTQAHSSLSTERTSTSTIHNFHVDLVSITSAPVTPILTTSTMGVTGTPVQYPDPTEHTLDPHSCYLSNNTHLKYLRNFPKDHQHLPNTISASDLFDTPQPSLSTSSVTTSEALNTLQPNRHHHHHQLPHPGTQHPSTNHSGDHREPTYTNSCHSYNQRYHTSSKPFSTGRTSNSHLSHTSSMTAHQSTSVPATSAPTGTTMSVTGTPVSQTTSVTPSRPQTPHTTHPSSTAVFSSTVHTTGLPSQTSIQSTSYFPTSSGTWSSSTPQSLFSTSFLSPTSKTPSTLTLSSVSTSLLLSTILPTTPMTGTRSPTTEPPVSSSTSATTQVTSAFTTARTSSSELSPSSVPHSSVSPSSSSLPTSFTSTVVSLSSVPHSPSVSSPTSFHSSASSPSSSMTFPLTPTPSSASPSPLFTTPTSVSYPSSVSSFESPTAASTPVNSSVSPLVTSSISSSALPTLPTMPTPSSRPTVSISLLSTAKTTSHVPTFSSFSSKSTTSQFTSLTTQASTSGLLSSTMGMTVFPSSPDTNHTTRPPGTSPLPTTAFLSSPATTSGSSSPSTLVSPSKPDSSISPSPQPETCSLQEEEREITYQGCTANVTLTRCQGLCASSVSFNTDTLQLETHCGCCQPLNIYEKQVSLPCPDPNAPGQQLTLTLQVFSSCACSSLQCKD
ncbi:hypothetical protein U0070_013178 [Myodes glareolus]|uniref:Mucin-6 n=1 Tax=Myodes glareolus TaxID=447135 RepID=A0AAW0HFK2_MYOGA